MSLKNDILNLELSSSQCAFFYTGQVGFIVKYLDKYVLIDGYLSDYVDKHCCSENVKWERKYAPPVKGEDLDFIDYVFCTHSHYDHADPYTLKAIADFNKKAVFIVPKAIKETIVSYGIEEERILGVSGDKNYSLDKISFTPVPSAHEELNQNDEGEYLELGYKITFGNTIIYHSGDCCLYDGLEERISGSDVLMIPINGRDYYRNKNDIIGCFDSNEAITLSKNVNASLLIPTHFDLYKVNEVNPAYFVDCLYKIKPSQAFHIFMPGEKYIFSKN